MSIWHSGAAANWIALVAVGVAVLGRRFRYGGMPRPAEWLPLVVLGMELKKALPGLDDLLSRLHHGLGATNFEQSVFLCFMATLAAGGAGIWLAGSLPSRLGGGPRTVAVVGAIVLLAWGPIRAFEMLAPIWLDGGPASSPTWGGPSAGRFYIGYAPRWMLYVVPFVLAVRSLWRVDWSSWRWTEQAAACGAVVWAGLLLFRWMEDRATAAALADLAYAALLIAVAVPLASVVEQIRWPGDQDHPSTGQEKGFMATEDELLGTWERRNAVVRQRLELRRGGTFAWSVHPGPPVLGALYLMLLPAGIKAGREGTWETAGKALILHGFPGAARLTVDEEDGSIILRQGEPGASPPYRRRRDEDSR